LDDDNWLEITNADGSTIGYASSKYLELIDKVSDTTALSVADRLEQEYLKKRDQLSGTNLNNEDSFDLGNLDTVAKFQYKESVIETRDSPIDSKIYDEVDQEPEIIGGIEALHRNLRYPQNARDSGIEGRVFVQFIVDEEGNVIDPVVISGLGGGCDEAALELVREAKFKPGILSGRAVKVNFLLPITFRLNN
jgi:TonB family protein